MAKRRFKPVPWTVRANGARCCRCSNRGPTTSRAAAARRMPRCPPRGRSARHSVLCPRTCRTSFGRIIDYFVDEYTAGRTPNPCVMCNNWLKFGKLFDYADSVGAEFVATGHYARLTPADGTKARRCCRGVDDGKDQSYVLFGIERGSACADAAAGRRLSQSTRFASSPRRSACAWPTRRTARRSALSPAASTTSSCGRGGGRRYLGRNRHDRRPRRRAHPGIERFTIGQRKGLGLRWASRTSSCASSRKRGAWSSARTRTGAPELTANRATGS